MNKIKIVKGATVPKRKPTNIDVQRYSQTIKQTVKIFSGITDDIVYYL